MKEAVTKIWKVSVMDKHTELREKKEKKVTGSSMASARHFAVCSEGQEGTPSIACTEADWKPVLQFW